MTRIELELKDKEARQQLRLLVKVLDGKQKLMAAIAAELLAQTERNFRTEAQGGGDKWPALAPATQKQRARKGHGAAHPMLKGRQPHLIRSLVAGFSEEQASLGTHTVYAAIHQLGGKAGKGHQVTIPPRPYLPLKANGKQLTDPMQRAVNKLLIRHFKNTQQA